MNHMSMWPAEYIEYTIIQKYVAIILSRLIPKYFSNLRNSHGGTYKLQVKVKDNNIVLNFVQ